MYKINCVVSFSHIPIKIQLKVMKNKDKSYSEIKAIVYNTFKSSKKKHN